MTTKKRSTSAAFVLLVMYLAAIPWWSWVSLVLWRWFAVPLGAPDMTLWHMAGLRGLVAMLTAKWTKDGSANNPDDDASRFGFAVLGPAVALGCGALFRWWMP